MMRSIRHLFAIEPGDSDQSALRNRWLWLIVSTVLAGCSSTPLQPQRDTDPAGIETIGVFSVGGETVPVVDASGETSGTTRINQALVRYLLPSEASRPPVIFLPGFALSADIYLSTPDGREGWAMQFLRAGHPVYLVEPGKTARAGIDPAAVNDGRSGRSKEESWLFSWDQENAWRRFGFGPRIGEPFDDAQLDSDDYPALVDMFTTVMVKGPGGRAMLTDSVDETLAGLGQLIEKTGPAILVVHSASGIPGFRFAAAHPERVTAVINIEPVGCPGSAAADFPSIPVLSIFADHYEYREAMARREASCGRLVENLAGRGVQAELMSLPAMGIRGNSHLPMAERNSDEIAALMLAWVERLETAER